jgi:hypothetical protein
VLKGTPDRVERLAMKALSIHPLSALAGAGLLGLVLIASGAVQVAGPVQRLALPTAGVVRIAGIPSPDEMMRVREGEVFVVPANKIFVVTGLGSALEHDNSVALFLDGQNWLVMHPRVYDQDVTTVRPVPAGLAATAGQQITVSGGNPLVASDAQVIGYLAQQ